MREYSLYFSDFEQLVAVARVVSGRDKGKKWIDTLP